MLHFFGGSGSRLFNNIPAAGQPAIAIGTGTFNGGPVPDFQGTAALGVNMALGYAGALLSLQVAGDKKTSIDRFGNLSVFGAAISSTDENFGPGNLAQFGIATMQSNAAGNTAVIARGFNAQTADILTVQDVTPTNQFAVSNSGTGIAPTWSLRVAPVANPESMVQAHVSGPSMDKAIQVIDNTGTTIGWIDLRA